MRLQFVGSGDAFGSGGRFNTCFHVTGETSNFLIDFGATSPVALKRLGLDHRSVDAVLITHFHGDHFGGLPFLILDSQLVSRRTRPLTIAGPPGVRGRFGTALDAAFPSFPHQPDRFALDFKEYTIGKPIDVGGLKVTAFPVVHAEAAGPCVGLRIEVEGKILAFSGDTEWTESLVDIGRNADLFVCECYGFKQQIVSHVDFMTLRKHMGRIAPKRLVLTHMSEEMLAHVDEVDWEIATDGKVVEF